MKPGFTSCSSFVVCGGETTSVRPGTSFSSRHSTSRIELSAAPEEYSRLPSGCQARPSHALSSASFWIDLSPLQVDDAQARLRPAVVRDHDVASVGVDRHRERQVADVEVAAGGRDAPAVREQRHALADRAGRSAPARRWRDRGGLPAGATAARRTRGAAGRTPGGRPAGRGRRGERGRTVSCQQSPVALRKHTIGRSISRVARQVGATREGITPRAAPRSDRARPRAARARRRPRGRSRSSSRARPARSASASRPAGPGMTSRSSAASPRPTPIAGQAAERRECDGLGQEHRLHLGGGGAERAQQADLAHALADRDPHHGQDPGRSHQQRDRGDRADRHRDHVHHLAEHVEHRRLGGHGEVLLAVPHVRAPA